jgi:hypothetical protein
VFWILIFILFVLKENLFTSVADPPEPHAFGLPGSGSGGMDQATDPDPSIVIKKIVRKTLLSIL